MSPIRQRSVPKRNRIAILVVAAFALAAAAPGEEADTWHVRCLERIDTDAEGAYEDALASMSSGGGTDARHCAAMALIALDHPEEAAARLETLANAPDGGSVGRRAHYLAQAGNAWLIARRPEAAEIAFDAALKLSPEDPELLKDRARARLLSEKWLPARDDLDAVLRDRPGDADALAMRARARLGLRDFDAAMQDIERARAAAPDRTDILLVRGEIREAIRRRRSR